VTLEHRTGFLRAHRRNWHSVARIKIVLIDSSPEVIPRAPAAIERLAAAGDFGYLDHRE
jgi:hypothetical protein